MKYLTLIVRILGAAALLLATNTALALNPNHQCTYCHNLHGGQVVPSNVEALCLSCHGPGGLSVLKAAVHNVATRITCIGCHDSHKDRQNWLGGTNRKMVGRKLDATGLAKIATPNSGVRQVVFESRGTDVGEPKLHSFADSDTDGNAYYDGVCETCHTNTGLHQNNGPSGHNTGRTCTVCHTHIRGFLP